MASSTERSTADRDSGSMISATVQHMDDTKHKGLVAARDFAVGEVILTEDTYLIRLLPDPPLAYQDWLQPRVIMNGKSLIIPEEIELRAKFRAMVQIVLQLLCMENKQEDSATDAASTKSTTERLLELYHPTLPSLNVGDTDQSDDAKNPPAGDSTTPTEIHDIERSLVELSAKVLTFISENRKPDDARCGPLADPIIRHRYHRILLVWACNAFDGGRIYERISRTNHSCCPNSCIVTDNANSESTRLCAMSPISKDSEITLSYLAPPALVWAGTAIRQQVLRRDKGFTCQCVRCSSTIDLARAVPCPTCHPTAAVLLDEDVQYDDEQTVHYVDYDTVKGRYAACGNCQAVPSPDDRLSQHRRSVEEKLAAYILTSHTTSSTVSNDEDDEEHDEYTRLASSVLGALHWTTNMLLERTLTRDITRYHSAILTGQDNNNNDEDLAACIDLLQRLYRFTDRQQQQQPTTGGSMALQQQAWLCDVTVGVARALVGLGDIRSQRSAAEWVAKIRTYVDSNSSSGLQKVVAAIANAAADGGPAQQRQKTG